MNDYPEFDDIPEDELINLIRSGLEALKTSAEAQNEFADKIKAMNDSYEDECKMCGRERYLNNKGYCASCWTIWNS